MFHIVRYSVLFGDVYFHLTGEHNNPIVDLIEAAYDQASFRSSFLNNQTLHS